MACPKFVGHDNATGCFRRGSKTRSRRSCEQVGAYGLSDCGGTVEADYRDTSD